MRPSRTRPTKLATAPILLSFEMARTSAPRSKSSSWTLTFILFVSSAGHRWKKRHLVPRLDRRGGLDHLLIYRRPHCAIRREHVGPGAAAVAQMLVQRAYGRDHWRQLEFLTRAAELLPERGEEEDGNLHQYSSAY